jgi:hypothetical protein
MNARYQEPLAGSGFEKIDGLVDALCAARQHDDGIGFWFFRRRQAGHGVGETQEAAEKQADEEKHDIAETSQEDAMDRARGLPRASTVP